MREKIGKWFVLTGAKILQRGVIVGLDGSIYIPSNNGTITVTYTGPSGGGAGTGVSHGSPYTVGGGGGPSTHGPFCGSDGRQCFRAADDTTCLRAGRCVGVGP